MPVSHESVSTMAPRTLIIAVSLLLLTACGFHLRGYQQPARIHVTSVYLQTEDNGEVAQSVQAQLKAGNSRLVDSAEAAEYVLRLGRQKLQRRVLSVSPSTGKAEEYQLTVSITLSITGSAGQSLVSGQVIKASRDYTFDEDAVLGKSSEEDVLRDELSDQVAGQVLNRLEAAAGSSQ